MIINKHVRHILKDTKWYLTRVVWVSQKSTFPPKWTEVTENALKSEHMVSLCVLPNRLYRLTISVFHSSLGEHLLTKRYQPGTSN